jgi:hypothetical protein
MVLFKNILLPGESEEDFNELKKLLAKEFNA